MGSFLQLWQAWRIVHGESVLRGRSHCDACGHVLAVRDLIPVVSYLAATGAAAIVGPSSPGVTFCRGRLGAGVRDAAGGVRQMPLGNVWGCLFFVFMAFASLSTVIAVFENLISWSMDKWGMMRSRAVIFNAVLVLVLSIRAR